MVRTGTPPAIIAQLNQEIVQILKSKQVQEKLLGYGVDPSPIDSAKEFADFLQTDIKRWSNLAREAGL